MATPNPPSNNKSQLGEHVVGDVLTQPATPEQSQKTPPTTNTPTKMPPLNRTMRCLFPGERKPKNPNKHNVQLRLPLGNICGCTMIPYGSDPIRNLELSKILNTTSLVNSTKYNPDLVLVESSTDEESSDEDEQPPNPKRTRE